MTNTTNAGDKITREDSANEQQPPTGAKYRNGIKNILLCLTLFFGIGFWANAWEEEAKGLAFIGLMGSSIAYSSFLKEKGSF
jgi:hypothetical protein